VTENPVGAQGPIEPFSKSPLMSLGAQEVDVGSETVVVLPGSVLEVVLPGNFSGFVLVINVVGVVVGPGRELVFAGTQTVAGAATKRQPQADETSVGLSHCETYLGSPVVAMLIVVV
jgi:hypothetical protein